MNHKTFTFVECAWAAILAVVAGLARLVPHAWNLTPMGGVSLFGGARLPAWLAFTLPLGIMAGTDAILWAWLPGWTPFNLAVYASLLVYVALGYFLLRKPTALTIVGVSLLGSLQFFLVTNFAIWLGASVPVGELGGASWAWISDPNYPYSLLKYTFDVSGLLACYAMALPFYGGTLAGDLIFPLVLFGLHRWLIEPTAEVEAVPGQVVERA